MVKDTITHSNSKIPPAEDELKKFLNALRLMFSAIAAKIRYLAGLAIKIRLSFVGCYAVNRVFAYVYFNNTFRIIQQPPAVFAKVFKG